MSPNLLHISAPNDEGEIVLITDESHDECGWPERIIISGEDGELLRSGCAGCESDRPLPERAGEATK